MARNDNFDNERAQPHRRINKQEAVRHLLHSAVRMVMKQEDPFAIHLIVHSADKILIDIAKKRGEFLRIDWELYIKDEYHKVFFKQHRETYNYLKHANEDFTSDLPVRDIMMLNVMTLFIAIANYASLFKEHTDHMKLFNIFVMNLTPAIIGQDFPQQDELLKSITMSQSMTPTRFFELFEEHQQMLPRYGREVSKDLEDVIDYYSLSFAELRAGRTKSSRHLRVPE